MRALKALGCAIALAAFIAPGARADEFNKLTYLTFSAPVQLPGVTLPAGTYTFKLADTWSNRHIVQVFDKDQSKIYGTFLTVSDQKLDAPNKPLVMFRESPAGTPNAVRAWFYPGDTIGDEFVYPKSQAVSIAKATHEGVMATDSDAAGNDVSAMKSAKVGHVDENGNMTTDAEDNRATENNANNANASAANTATDTQSQPAATGTSGTSATAPSGTTGTYTAAPRENDHRTGVTENGDVMNRYNDQAANRTNNPSMAAGGETVTSNRPSSTENSAQTGTSASNSTQTGTTASSSQPAAPSSSASQQTGTTASAASQPSSTSDQANGRHMNRRHARHNNAAVGTSGQSDTNAQNNNKSRNGRHLPRTASPLGLMLVFSGLSLAGALSVRGLRRFFVDAR